MNNDCSRIYLNRLDGITELQLLHNIAFIQNGGEIPERIIFPDKRYATFSKHSKAGYLIYDEEEPANEKPKRKGIFR